MNSEEGGSALAGDLAVRRARESIALCYEETGLSKERDGDEEKEIDADGLSRISAIDDTAVALLLLACLRYGHWTPAWRQLISDSLTTQV